MGSSGDSIWRKIADDPDYTSAVGAPGFTSSQHSWKLLLRGCVARCFVGVCGNLSGRDLIDFPFGKFWGVHFTGDSDGSLGNLYKSGRQRGYDGGKPTPMYDPGTGLLIELHIDVEAGMLQICFLSPSSDAYELTVE